MTSSNRSSTAPRTAFKRRDLAMVYNNLGNLQVEIGRFDDARTTHEKALALREGLVREHPDDARSAL